MFFHFSEAPPREPYPIIEGCNDSVTLGNNYGCVISTHVGVNITCSASDFFPDLHFFFLHGSEKIAPLGIRKWTNDDGTRSKSVTVSALPHEIPYLCVASDVPGNMGERAGTVFCKLDSAERHFDGVHSKASQAKGGRYYRLACCQHFKSKPVNNTSWLDHFRFMFCVLLLYVVKLVFLDTTDIKEKHEIYHLSYSWQYKCFSIEGLKHIWHAIAS